MSARPFDLPVHRLPQEGVRDLAGLQGAHWRRSHDRPEFLTHARRSRPPDPRSRENPHRPQHPNRALKTVQLRLDRGIPVHLFVSNSPLPRGVETSQIERLREVEEKYKRLGIVGSYNDPEDLTGKLRTVFESDISDIQEPSR